MIRLTLGVIPDVISLLLYIKKYGAKDERDLKATKAVSSISIADTIEFGLSCELLMQSEDKVLLTDTATTMLENYRGGSISFGIQRAILSSYISNTRPAWAYKIPSGRQIACIYMTNDEKSCFRYAGLLDTSHTPDVIEWWDNVARIFRSEHDQKLLETGRKGERFSFDYEILRTQIEPQWKSIESNILGYDIESVIEPNDDSTLYIEVKSSEYKFSNAEFYVSINEWQVAQTHPNHYLFHLWLLGAQPKLAIIKPEALSDHIPLDHGKGNWKTVSIPFSACCNEADFFTFPKTD